MTDAKLEPLPEPLLQQLLSVAVPTLSQALYAKGLRTRFLHGLTPCNSGAARFCGPAFTVRAIPVREDLRDAVTRGEAPNLHRLAFDAAPAGSVLVCATDDAVRVSVLGDIIATALMRRGVAGVVVDTGVADIAAFGQIELPVFCAGSAPVPSPAQIMVVDHGLPIGIAGVAVFPGDIMVGDANGVVCIPRAMAAAIAAAAIEKEDLEEFIVEQIAAGAPLATTYPPDAATMARYRAWRAASVTGSRRPPG